jgi:hypothetical protein
MAGRDAARLRRYLENDLMMLPGLVDTLRSVCAVLEPNRMLVRKE